MNITQIRSLIDAGLTDDQITAVMELQPASQDPEPAAPAADPEPEATEPAAPAKAADAFTSFATAVSEELKKINDRITAINLETATAPAGKHEVMSADDITKNLIYGGFSNERK